VAVTYQRDLGVDIEVNRAIPHLDSLGQRYLAPLEIEQLARADDRVRAFWTAWTRKEAYIKALGTGLSERLCEFAVSLSTPGRLLTTARLDDDMADWTMLDLSSDVHLVAVAVRARSVSVDVH